MGTVSQFRHQLKSKVQQTQDFKKFMFC